MDDEDADYMEEDGFEYSDGGGESDEVGDDLENRYYMAKGKEDNPEGALKDFKSIAEAEPEKGDWGFKALKQSTKLLFLVLHRPEEALKTYKQLLTYTKSAVTRNYSEKTINNILNYVGGGKGGTVEVEILERFYEATRFALREAKNERLSVKTNLKLAKLWLDKREYHRLQKLLAYLQQSTQQGGDEDQSAKGTLLQEIYALQIQMYNETKNYKKLKEIYYASGQVTSAISHPRVVGVIKECEQWERASEDFFSSFHNYDEAGSPQRIQVLKYLVLAYLLMGSEIDPFDSQETKPYKTNPQIKAVTGLVSAYQRKEVHEAEKILRENQSTFMDDPFIKPYIGDLLRALRTQYLIALIKPYTRLDLSFLARQLNIDKAEVEEILTGLILEGKVEGRIDQVKQLLELDKHQILEKRRYQALDQWTAILESIHGAVVNKTAGRSGSGPDVFDFEEILTGLILEGKVEGRIDQVKQLLELDKQNITFYYERKSELINGSPPEVRPYIDAVFNKKIREKVAQVVPQDQQSLVHASFSTLPNTRTVFDLIIAQDAQWANTFLTQSPALVGGTVNSVLDTPDLQALLDDWDGSGSIVTTVMGFAGLWLALQGLAVVGFTATGVAAGSLAAIWQASIGNVAAGSIFASFQSMGALGALTGPAGIAAVVVGGASYGIYKWATQPTPEKRLVAFLESLLKDRKKRNEFWGTIDV